MRTNELWCQVRPGSLQTRNIGAHFWICAAEKDLRFDTWITNSPTVLPLKVALKRWGLDCWFSGTTVFFLLRKRRERGLNLSVTKLFHFGCRLECITAWGWHGKTTSSGKLPITFEFHWNALRHKDEMENCKFTWVELVRFTYAPNKSTNISKKAKERH